MINIDSVCVIKMAVIGGTFKNNKNNDNDNNNKRAKIAAIVTKLEDLITFDAVTRWTD